MAGADHRSADTLYNLDACGAGFQIRGNHMRGNRRYGCLLRAGGGVVENNTFEDTTGAGVVLTNEPDWPEGPVPWGITIRGNRFLRGGTCLGYADSPHGAALSVRPTRLGHGLAEAESIRDVIIENNDFEDRAGTALFIGGASNVGVSNNRIQAAPNAELRRKGPAILIDRSSRVTLSDNTVSDLRPGTTAAVEIGPTVAPAERPDVGLCGLSREARFPVHRLNDRGTCHELYPISGQATSEALRSPGSVGAWRRSAGRETAAQCGRPSTRISPLDCCNRKADATMPRVAVPILPDNCIAKGRSRV